MKKVLVYVLSAALVLGFTLPAAAIELAPENAKGVPSSFATVKDGVVTYGAKPVAYSPDTMNAILTAYGLQLAPEAVKGIPASYASVNKEGKVVFGSKPTAYSAGDLHAIFTAYGLVLDDAGKIAVPGYVKAADGKMVFGGKPTAYSGLDYAKILAGYYVPGAPVPVAAAPVPPPPPAPAPAKPLDSDGDGVTDDKDACPGTPKGAKIDSRGCWVLEHDYLFDFDKAVIKTQYYPILNDVAKVIKDNPSLRVQLDGHTDSIGTDAYNKKLSERRAQAVKKYLMEKAGIEGARLTTVGYGESRPIADNKTKEGRAKNRRVELTPIW